MIPCSVLDLATLSPFRLTLTSPRKERVFKIGRGIWKNGWNLLVWRHLGVVSQVSDFQKKISSFQSLFVSFVSVKALYLSVFSCQGTLTPRMWSQPFFIAPFHCYWELRFMLVTGEEREQRLVPRIKAGAQQLLLPTTGQWPISSEFLLLPLSSSDRSWPPVGHTPLHLPPLGLLESVGLLGRNLQGQVWKIT